MREDAWESVKGEREQEEREEKNGPLSFSQCVDVISRGNRTKSFVFLLSCSVSVPDKISRFLKWIGICH